MSKIGDFNLIFGMVSMRNQYNYIIIGVVDIVYLLYYNIFKVVDWNIEVDKFILCIVCDCRGCV